MSVSIKKTNAVGSAANKTKSIKQNKVTPGEVGSISTSLSKVTFK